MVEPVFLAILAITFLVILVIILKGGNNPQPTKEKTQKQKQQPAKEKKPKAPKRTALKKDKRPNEIKEWTGVDTAAKDAHEMLEFLKGRDPAEIAKQHVVQARQQSNKKGKGNNNKKIKEEEVEASPVFEVGSNEGFSVIQKAKKGKGAEVKEKPKGAEVKEKKERNKSKAFFKEEEDSRKKENKKGERKPRKEKPQASEEATPEEEGEKKKKPQGEREFQPRPPRENNNKERPPREEKDQNKPRERRERKEKSEDEEQSKPKRNYPTSPPNVAYVEADLNDILNAITQDYNTKPKPQTHRISSIFSKFPRTIMTLILSQLEARDLVALSEVNNYFSALARKDVFWKDLLLRDFGVRDSGNYRSFKAAYKVKYKKKHQQQQQQQKKKQQQGKEGGVEPQDELKDNNKQLGGKKDNKKKKEETEKVEAVVATSTEEAESKEDKE